VLENGRGSVRVRAKWSYDKENNCIDVTQIPPTTTVEAIMDKITELVKLGKIREISDMRDETDLNGLKLTIDLKRPGPRQADGAPVQGHAAGGQLRLQL
jgi:DNA gyrase subunit A